MGFFGRLFGGKKVRPDEQAAGNMSAGESWRSASSMDECDFEPRDAAEHADEMSELMRQAETCIANGDYEGAVKAYRQVLKLGPDKKAQYNLGSLCAQGKGTSQDFMEGGYWFHQAELAGNLQAGKLCLKCAMDYIHGKMETRSAQELYEDMARFVRHVLPERPNVNEEVCRRLYAFAGNHINKNEYEPAAKLLRASAEFGGDWYSQSDLAALYNTGSGVKQNDLAALYWLDKAIDNGAGEDARTDRNELLAAYKAQLSKTEFRGAMMKLAEWCTFGSEMVPRDTKKAVYWRNVGKSGTWER